MKETVRESKLIKHNEVFEFNERLQQTIDLYNRRGYVVRIEFMQTNSAHVGGGGSTTTTTLHNVALVVGYDTK